MLTGKQKRYLRSMAHHVQPVTQVGKGGVSDPMIEQINLALEAHELVKVSILQNCEEDKKVVAHDLAARSGAELVQLIGKQVVLYKESQDHKTIELP
ncbi:MAG TPA: ribosome assembly RNA-binding protein YhbY [Bacilli bacterium]|nr:ribosome assembly RNA-binding protein YhbY [Bacilli bacterium]